MDIKSIQERLQRFADERDWEQFHSPKNLAMALSVESSELVEHFQWLTQEQSRELPKEKIGAVEQEIGDVFIYLMRLADKLNIDLLQAAQRKIEVNEQKYPVAKAKGNAKKYTELEK
ncbi:nucleotide pyrophosphohydrolase [Desulfobacula sp.]|uniref:nucleotide pyrophosphohydrolase n=1 Tax=Desulfobacula sp. TaxID=2593537 RepID=UPI002632221B|nr:nucleotide pyrophosphohydrolase [Desulfobacula sp.]